MLPYPEMQFHMASFGFGLISLTMLIGASEGSRSETVQAAAQGALLILSCDFTVLPTKPSVLRWTRSRNYCDGGPLGWVRIACPSTAT